MTTRRQKKSIEMAVATLKMWEMTDQYGRPRFTLEEIKKAFGLSSNAGVYYRIDKAQRYLAEESSRRRQHGLASKTRKDLTNDK